MDYLSEIMITSNIENIRTQCRQVIIFVFAFIFFIKDIFVVFEKLPNI